MRGRRKKQKAKERVLCTMLYLYIHGEGFFFEEKVAIESPFKSRLAKRLGRQPRIVLHQNRLPQLSVWQRTARVRMLRLR